MFRNLFNPESPLMLTMTQVTDCIFLSLFWLLGCFPLVTAGTSFAALYDASFRAFRQGEKHSWQRFWGVFRENFRSGLIPTAVFLGAAALGGRGLIQIWNAAAAGDLGWMVFSAAALVGVLALGVLSVLFPMLSRFENKTAALLRNTLFLSLANLPRTLVLGILNAAAAWLCLRFVFPLFFLPALAALAGSFLLEPMFRPYMPQEDAAE